MRLAFTRAVSPRLAECETTQAGRVDVARAIEQHAAYERALAAAGLEVRRLAALDDFPDAVFVEDTALLLGEHAVILRPGAASRAGETGSTAEALADAFTVHRLEAGHVDGGDVLRIGRTLYVGLSSRTDEAGLRALAEAVAPLGYDVVPVPVAGGLHLKSAATCVAGLLVHNPDWVSASHFTGIEPVAVAAGEAYGGNVLQAGAILLAAADSPRTAGMLAARGFEVVTLDISEMRKADAALTCMSLIGAPPA
ncbi:MAG TPA: N(G),N(G)-dimethylarginine dimethylaminohydrolase [Allosphingosinicella sp.]|jgi:dimethylargininase|nr:N(G),N(G)-dimethylarginine dimethylaminohydrolase [Allosphingosinicella sp.]